MASLLPLSEDTFPSQSCGRVGVPDSRQGQETDGVWSPVPVSDRRARRRSASRPWGVGCPSPLAPRPSWLARLERDACQKVMSGSLKCNPCQEVGGENDDVE